MQIFTETFTENFMGVSVKYHCFSRYGHVVYY